MKICGSFRCSETTCRRRRSSAALIPHSSVFYGAGMSAKCVCLLLILFALTSYRAAAVLVCQTLSAGGYHTCALSAGGAVRCWGKGDNGRLGYGNIVNVGDSDARLPSSVGDVSVSSTNRVVQISAGEGHTCALLDNGRVRCWGRGASGQLGYGDGNDVGDNAATLPSDAGDVNVSATHRVVQISTGFDFSCALLENGKVRCWGRAAEGQLGYGDYVDVGDAPSRLPSLVGDVDVSATDAVVQVSTGWSHACALLDNGRVRCWGRGEFGRLGYGNTADTGGTPDAVPSAVGDVNVSTTHRVIQVSAGGEHTCALLENGKVRCWGHGDVGQLGYGRPDNVSDLLSTLPSIMGDVSISSTERVVQIACGLQHSCALLKSGRVRCWGSCGLGRLGYGGLVNVGDSPGSLPISVGDVNISATERVVQISAGIFHTCALLEGGVVRCWGFGGSGALGYGNTTSVGWDISFLPINAGDVSVGWNVSTACINVSGAVNVPIAVDARSQSSPWLWIIIGSCAAAIVCITLAVSILVCLWQLNRRRNKRTSAQHTVGVLRRETHTSGADSSRTSRTSRHGGGRSLAQSGAARDVAGPLGTPLHDGYDVLPMRPRSRSASRARVRGVSSAAAVSHASVVQTGAIYESSSAALGSNEYAELQKAGYIGAGETFGASAMRL